MRLFVAIELNDEARAAMDRERQRLVSAMGAAARDVRWVRPEHLHVTLVFLGEVAASQSSAVIEALTRNFEQPPYDMTIGGLGIFPTRGAPRALWAGVPAGFDETVALQSQVTSRLPTTTHRRSARDTRAFTPHLTLARWRRGHSSRRWMLKQPTHSLAVVPVEGVTLFESRLSRGGPTYTALARPRLICPRA